MKKEISNHNGYISLWKFIFSIVIVIYHTATFYGGERIPFGYAGYLAVEFFFMVSGYYLVKGIMKNKNNTKTLGKDTFDFIIKKLKSFYPYIIISYVIAIPILIFCADYNIYELTDSVWSFLLLKGIGVGKSWLFGPLWYISAMIVSMMILYPIIKKYRENYIYIFSPIISILGLAFMYNRGSLNMSYASWDGYICLSIVRSFIEMNMGCLIYCIIEKYKKVEFTKTGKIFFTALSQCLMLSSLLVIIFLDRASLYQYIILLIFFISILIMVSNALYETRILNNKFVYYLEHLSLIIYIVHNVVLHLVKFSGDFQKYTPNEKSIITLFFVMLISLFIDYIYKLIKKINIAGQIKKILIKN